MSTVSVKSNIMSLLRKAGAAPLVDYCQYVFRRLQNSGKNSAFRAEYPDAVLPPPYLVYESFQMDYRKYYLGGKETAKWVASLISPHLKRPSGRILDWGCGPARVIRHMHEVIGSDFELYGCDYNPRTISWCKKSIPTVQFALNGLHPPLPYQQDFFDALYGISIFTHLSEENHVLWAAELHRVLKSGGIALLTTHGEAFKARLTSSEVEQFNAGNLVIRSKAKEGQRMFGAFHPPGYLHQLFGEAGFDMVQHIPGRQLDHRIEQDTWILNKIV